MLKEAHLLYWTLLNKDMFKTTQNKLLAYMTDDCIELL